MWGRLVYIFWRLAISPRNPEGLRRTFEDLGPAFVKFGQILASRPDVVSREYSEEFRKLLDQGPEVPFLEIKEVLNHNWGEDWWRDFQKVEEIPISSASIAQVHRAKLKKGGEVVIKVRRPGIKEVVNQDVKILLKLSGIVDRIPFYHGIGLQKVLADFATWITTEMDLASEAGKAKTMAKNLASFPDIVIPKIFDKYVTEEVLVEEYLDGVTVNELLDLLRDQRTKVENVKLPFKFNAEIIISNMVDCYLFKQILTDGYFHGDPHPANIIIMSGNRVGLVDFGIMAVLDKKEHDQILMCLLGIVDDDPTTIVKVLTSISERELSRHEEMEVTDKISDQLHKMHGGSWKEASVGDLLMNVVSVGKMFDLHWGSGVILGIRAVALIEGIGLRLIPTTSLVDLIKPHMRKFLAKEALAKFSEDELYRDVLQMMQLSRKIATASDIIGDRGLKVEVADRKEVSGNGS